MKQGETGRKIGDADPPGIPGKAILPRKLSRIFKILASGSDGSKFSGVTLLIGNKGVRNKGVRYPFLPLVPTIKGYLTPLSAPV
jgi:hypothetical protein